MGTKIQPITITPEQIIAAAQLIANKDENAWDTTADDYLAAVRSYLECCFFDILADADWYANKDHFFASRKYTTPFVDSADELIMPPAPEWATEEAEPV